MSVEEGRRSRIPGRATPRRRRRPSGEPPPLPRKLGRSGKIWIGLVAYVAGLLIVLVFFFQPLADIFDRFDSFRLQGIASIRTDWLTDWMLVVNGLGSRWTIRALRWGTIAVLIGFRRWRHLFVFLGSVVFIEFVAYQLSIFFGRHRPLGVRIIGDWEGFSMPSRPVAGLAVTLIGMAYALVVSGRARSVAKWAAGIVIGLFVFARLYLAVDHPTDAGFAAIFGIAVPLVAFRWFAPNDVFPVTYRRGKTAH